MDEEVGSQAIVNLNDFVDLYRKSLDIANQLMLSRFIKPLSGQFRAALVPHRILISMRRAVSAILLEKEAQEPSIGILILLPN